jgi:exonuclease III
MRLVSWNMRNAGSPEGWRLLLNLKPDLALLQEVVLPEYVTEKFTVFQQSARHKTGREQSWGSAVLARPRLQVVQTKFSFGTRPWVGEELDKLGGCFLPAELQTATTKILLVSCYSPWWDLDLSREDVGEDEIRKVRLKAQPRRIWGADLLWSYMHDQVAAGRECVVGGDFNISARFDETWGHGNQEFIDRMAESGFVDCLRKFHPDLGSTPTFRNPKGGKVEHQLDYLWATPQVAAAFRRCDVGSSEVHSLNISDHLPIVADWDA